jgi:hypothetical protein
VDTVSQNHQAAHTDLNAYFASALEHGIIEQFQPSNLVAASTVKMLQVASTNGQAVYLASSTNWTGTPNVQGKLVNYDTATKNIITGYINAGYYVLLPQNGSNHVSGTTGWAGYGYEVRLRSAGLPMTNVTGMLISGGYHGGYAVDKNATASTPTVVQSDDSQPFVFTVDSPFNIPVLAADPVDMADGTFQVEHTDLSLGQAEPLQQSGGHGGWLGSQLFGECQYRSRATSQFGRHNAATNGTHDCSDLCGSRSL